jgi:hypothetical protein
MIWLLWREERFQHRMKTILTMLVAAFACYGQDALVIQLSATDAAKAKQLYEAKIAAEKAWKEFNSHVSTFYTTEKKLKNDGCVETVLVRNGWTGGFTFSKDFKFIIPKPDTNIVNWGSLGVDNSLCIDQAGNVVRCGGISGSTVLTQ